MLFPESDSGGTVAALFGDIAEAVRAARTRRREEPVAVLVGPVVGEFQTEPESCGSVALGRVAGRPVVMPADPAQSDATFAVRVGAALGARILVVTAKAWGLRPVMRAGQLLVFADHINATGANPLTGLDEPRLGPRFLDMSAAYDEGLRLEAESVARQREITMHRGVYLATTGRLPGTDDDLKAMRMLGADAAGTGGVAETIVGVQSGLRVLGLASVEWDARNNRAETETGSSAALDECVGAIVSRT